MKKGLLILLLVSFVFSVSFAACLSVRAEEQEIQTLRSGDFEYILLEDGTAEIWEYLGKKTDVVIPEELDGIPVTKIGGYAFSVTDDNRVTTVSIPEGVTEIGKFAFSYCWRLTGITLPESLAAIGDSAFLYCEGLREITIPDSVAEIGTNPFAGCSGLKEITVSPEHPYFETVDGILFSKADRRLVSCPQALKTKEFIIPDGTEKIGPYAFYDCHDLTDITIPGSVTEIGDYAFSACGLRDGTVIPEGVRVIGECAFGDCDRFVSVTLPEGVETIGDSAFEHCDLLTEIILPDSVAEMGGNPFVNCPKLKSIVISPGHPCLELVNGVLFSKPDRRLICYPKTLHDKTFTIPDGTAVIGKNAFYGNGALTWIVIPDGVTDIGTGAFFNCEKLEAVTIPDSVQSIDIMAFDSCSPKLKITVGHGSYAEEFCLEKHFTHIYP